MDIIPTKENIIYEDEETIAFLSIHPISKGHVIIQPKQKYKGIDELPEKLLYKILKLTQCYVRLLKKEYAPKGYSILQDSSEFSNTAYFQFNIFAREPNTGFSWTYSEEVEADATKFEKMKHLLKDEFQLHYKI